MARAGNLSGGRGNFTALGCGRGVSRDWECLRLRIHDLPLPSSMTRIPAFAARGPCRKHPLIMEVQTGESPLPSTGGLKWFRPNTADKATRPQQVVGAPPAKAAGGSRRPDTSSHPRWPPVEFLRAAGRRYLQRKGRGQFAPSSFQLAFKMSLISVVGRSLFAGDAGCENRPQAGSYLQAS